MSVECILLRKLESWQYFDQFLSLTDILYEWQCLMPQNHSISVNAGKLFFVMHIWNKSEEHEVRHGRKLCNVLWISQAMNPESSRTMKDI